MSSPGSQQWTTGFQTWRRSGRNPGFRVSDADRAEVADLLSKHFSAGRLDQAEFDERMQRAMNAKTQGDFDGLFDDLPDLPGGDQAGAEGPGRPYRPVINRRYGRSSLERLAFFAFVIVAAVIAAHVLFNSWFLWLVVGFLALIVLRGTDRRRR